MKDARQPSDQCQTEIDPEMSGDPNLKIGRHRRNEDGKNKFERTHKLFLFNTWLCFFAKLLSRLDFRLGAMDLREVPGMIPTIRFISSKAGWR